MSSAGYAVELRRVTKSYQLGRHQVRALRGVDLQVRPGELLGLTGPSGSGKSTILNLCGLVDAADSGDVLLAGRSIERLSEKELALLRRERLGFIFQAFNLIPVMTVEENVDYPLFLMGVGKKERATRVAEQLEAVGLQAHAKHRPDALSGGQRQRVAIARALIKQPALVIADEPTASLDTDTANQILDLMKEQCHRQGAAFVIATHDDRLKLRCDRVLTLRDGQIQ